MYRQGARSRGALLLNHLTTPHVLVRSAVHASCSLPTVMKPTALLAKDAAGKVSRAERSCGLVAAVRPPRATAACDRHVRPPRATAACDRHVRPPRDRRVLAA